jgi:hypothetical protein
VAVVAPPPLPPLLHLPLLLLVWCSAVVALLTLGLQRLVLTVAVDQQQGCGCLQVWAPQLLLLMLP